MEAWLYLAAIAIALILIGAIFALPLAIPPLRRRLSGAAEWRGVAVGVMSGTSFVIVFWLIALWLAQVNIIFSCFDMTDTPLCSPIDPNQIGLTPQEFMDLAADELYQRNLRPAWLRKSCHIPEIGVCFLMDQSGWQNVGGSFAEPFLPALLAGGVTAVTALRLTRNRKIVGESAG